MIGYYNTFKDGNETMPIRCDDKILLKKFEKLFKDISNMMNKEFSTGPTYKMKITIHM